MASNCNQKTKNKKIKIKIKSHWGMNIFSAEVAAKWTLLGGGAT
jgi:hypothetical protein